jgi:hypothetical protein
MVLMAINITGTIFEKKKEARMSCNFGGGTVMVGGAFSFAGKQPLAWISTKMNSQDYIDL